MRKTEPLSHGLKRVTQDELQAAVQLLRQADVNSRSRAVHEGRKSIKKTRAVLELLRKDLGTHYRRTRKQLRRAAQTLAVERDAHVMLQIFNGLRARHRASIAPATWIVVHNALAAAAARASRSAKDPLLARRTVEALHDVRTQSRAWRLTAEDFSALTPGLTRSFTRARDAYGRAASRRDATSLHQWRKRVKAHWYQIRLFEAADPRRLRPYGERLHQLETWLGEHHNLVVLRNYLRSRHFDAGFADDIDRLVEIILREEAMYRTKALVLGRRLYGGRRATVVERLQRMWRAWRP